jgi:hypothetical protein
MGKLIEQTVLKRNYAKGGQQIHGKYSKFVDVRDI